MAGRHEANFCACRHKAINAYLGCINLPEDSIAHLKEELQIGEGFDAATTKKYEWLLEKKWTSVVRLQKKVSSSNLMHMTQIDLRA